MSDSRELTYSASLSVLLASCKRIRPIANSTTMGSISALPSLGREIAISDLLRVLKSNSSKWIHDTYPTLRNFHWQAGFAVFAVSFSNLGCVKAYIARQKEHHQRRTFQDELREFLHKHKISYDERYVWD